MKYLDRQPSKDASFGLLGIQALLLVFSLLLGGASSVLNFMIIVPISICFAIYLAIAESSQILFYKGVPIRFFWVVTLALADVYTVIISIYILEDQSIWFFVSKLLFYGLLFLIQVLKLSHVVKLLGKQKVMWFTVLLSNMMSTGLLIFAYLGTVILFDLLAIPPFWRVLVWFMLVFVQGFKLLFPFINNRFFDVHYRFHRVYDIIDSFLILILPIWSLLALFLFSKM